ncbi:MAG: bis(5'-nucleosyl)-tetraphosphatase (symmetrical) YqeK [Clostridiales bacterium]|jgi:predicted HD superfamily hydrolase involved in NAD metabolism|nr:bis(5'-nucleosyl)-tetraphosphatase (symmetrical) YqeK [Clostridiales bacterium]
MNKEIIEKKLKNTLSENRFRHSLSVARESEKLAKFHKVPVELAYLAGIMHDCAKEFSVRDSLEILKKHNVALDKISLNENKLLHAHVGAIVAREEYGIKDSQVLDAIRYHTTAKENMSSLLKIIYVSDSIDPTKKHDSTAYVRRLSFNNLNKASLVVLTETINRLISRNSLIHPNTFQARNDLIIKSIKIFKKKVN